MKDVVCFLRTVAAPIMSTKLEVKALRDAVANTLPSDAAQIKRLQRRDTTTKDVAADTPHMDAALMEAQQPLAPATKDAHATHINSDAAQMASALLLDPTTKDVTVQTASSSAVLTMSRLQRDRTSKDAHALQASLDAALTEALKLKQPTSRDAKTKFLTHPRRLAVLNETWEHAVTTTPSNTSLILNMAAAVDSGMVDAEETRIASILKVIAKTLAWNHPAKTSANSPKFMDHAPVTIQCGITTPIATLALSSSMEDVSEMPTDLRRSKTANHSALLTTKDVSAEVIMRWIY